jgi:integrase
MHRLFQAAEIRTATGRTPRTHDLRFTFAVHALLRWYRSDVDVQARLPALSAYMGHGSIVSTEYYLTFLDAIAEAASARFDRHCSAFLSTASIAGGGS